MLIPTNQGDSVMTDLRMHLGDNGGGDQVVIFNMMLFSMPNTVRLVNENRRFGPACGLELVRPLWCE